MKILNIEELEERIAEYSKMFPENHMTLDDIKMALIHEYNENGTGQGVFGFSVSQEWEDKCYGFEFDPYAVVPTCKFVGMYKC